MCLSDETFPGFPTFPVVDRPHLEAFDGLLSPPEFVNQDADPFTYEVYRRFGATAYAPGVPLTNGIGGDWKDRLLEGVNRVAKWLGQVGNSSESVDTHASRPWT